MKREFYIPQFAAYRGGEMGLQRDLFGLPFKWSDARLIPAQGQSQTNSSSFLPSFAFLCAEEAEIAIRSNQPSLIESDPEEKRASVAIIILNGHILYCKRANNIRDRWSGHIAFPGGKREPNEDDLECCIRERREETGIEMKVEHLIGRLADREVKLPASSKRVYLIIT